MPADDKNLLAYGDNLDVLRRYVAPESVDLVYLDPPFNSNATYNLLYSQQDGTRAAAQIKAFNDTWRWDQAAVAAFEDSVEAGGPVSRALQAFRTILGTSDMLAYLAMMAPRLVRLREVLKPSGSIYLHCDPTAAHYLKLLMDAVFGPENFRNDIVWKRKTGRGATQHAARRFGVANDNLLFYVKGREAVFHGALRPNDPEYIRKAFRHVDERGRYRIDNLASPSLRPNLRYVYKGYQPPAKGWAVSRTLMERMEREGRLAFPRTMAGRIQRKRYLDQHSGQTVDSIWDDVRPISSQAAERLGYPTQKPIALLERIIAASTDLDAVVLDPFAGCGTAVIAAERMGRRWIGLDVTHHATALIKHRLMDEFGPGVAANIRVIGEPTTAEDAAVLAADDPFQFQAWALGLVGARPLNGVKKGADRGIDGQLYFHESEGGITRQVLLSVKAGHTGPAHVRDLRGVIEREQADIGVLISLADSTSAMRSEAADVGFYEFKGKRYPKLQLRSISELLAGRGIEYPPTVDTVFRPTIWPPESIPSVPKMRRPRPRKAAIPATAAPVAVALPERESVAASGWREEYARHAADEESERRRVAEEALTQAD